MGRHAYKYQLDNNIICLTFPITSATYLFNLYLYYFSLYGTNWLFQFKFSC